MCTPVVVDANCINQFQHERIAEAPGSAIAAIEHIFANGWLVMDAAGLCKQEWLDCARGPLKLNLSDWIGEQLVIGRLKVCDAGNDKALRKALKAFGMPKKDQKWIELARSSNAFGIVSEDSDLYEPKAKKWNAARKEKLKNDRSGCICKFSRKELGVEIMRLGHVRELVPECGS